ncbi:MAG: hypothetical protein GX361_09425 [Bacteroidales bacterium]|nr:hypothetical protein [Bacteroidales bacterium]
MLFAVLACGTTNTGNDDNNGIIPPTPPPGKTFRAGASARSILPPANMNVKGGRTVVESPSDSIYAKSLLLDDGNTKLLFVVLDLTSLDHYVTKVAKESINRRTGIPTKNIMISCTHTHSSIYAVRYAGYQTVPIDECVWENWELNDYQAFVVNQITKSAAAALSNLEPAQIGWGKAEVPQWVFNRRYRMKNATQTTPWGEKEYVHCNPPTLHPDIIEPVGPVDPEVTFISVKSIKGHPLALFASYPPHYPADIPEPYVSSDYYGVFAKEIQTFLKAEKQEIPFVGAITIGTCGDLNAINRMASRPSGNLREQMGFDVARGVYNAYTKLEHKSWVQLDVAQSVIKLAARKVTDPAQLEYAQFLLDRRSQGLPYLNHRLEIGYAQQVFRMRKCWPDVLDITLQAFRIGDLAAVAIPFEVFVETGLSIKQKSPFEGTYINSLSNGAFGYLPTEQQHELGGYETWIALSNRVEKSAATKIEAEVLNLLGELNK